MGEYMGNIKEDNITGTQQGIFDVLYECDFKSNDGHRMFHVKCIVCGWETNVQMHRIKHYKKCVHISAAKRFVNYNTKGDSQRLRTIFNDMITRCYNVNDKNYRWYGAKGIKIYEKWLDNPKLFEQWAIDNGYEDNLTIDRINEDKDYCPDNCWWITLENNSKYKSTTDNIMVNDITHTGRDWSKKLGFGCNTINNYVRTYGKGNTIEFIKAVLKNPNLKNFREGKQSYYDLYMN